MSKEGFAQPWLDVRALRINRKGIVANISNSLRRKSEHVYYFEVLSTQSMSNFWVLGLCS